MPSKSLALVSVMLVVQEFTPLRSSLFGASRAQMRLGDNALKLVLNSFSKDRGNSM